MDPKVCHGGGLQSKMTPSEEIAKRRWPVRHQGGLGARKAPAHRDREVRISLVHTLSRDSRVFQVILHPLFTPANGPSRAPWQVAAHAAAVAELATRGRESGLQRPRAKYPRPPRHHRCSGGPRGRRGPAAGPLLARRRHHLGGRSSILTQLQSSPAGGAGRPSDAVRLGMRWQHVLPRPERI